MAQAATGAAVVAAVRSTPLVPLANQREHIGRTMQRKAHHRHITTLALDALVKPHAKEALLQWLAQGATVIVTITRLGKRALDAHDNLPSSAKHVVDGVAAWLGVDDADPRLVWRYEQASGDYGVGIRLALGSDPHKSDR